MWPFFEKNPLRKLALFAASDTPDFGLGCAPSFRKASDTQVFGLRVCPDFGSSGWTLILHAHSPDGCIRKKHPHLVLKKMLLSSASCFDRPRECHKKWSVQINVMIVSVHFWTRSMHITRQSVVNSVIAYLRFRVSIQ